MDENMERRPYSDDPAEGRSRVDEDGSPSDDRGAPLGGDDVTEDQLQADNPTERDTLKSLDPDDSPA
ncbi:hypothetical protein [Microbacterium sp. LWO13-1.2]|uniref:hypothetical protein n=1 Tax=Microbacterium sp. LWO13-1.2 TaxID=3135262 RepID=UPI003139ABBD